MLQRYSLGTLCVCVVFFLPEDWYFATVSPFALFQVVILQTHKHCFKIFIFPRTIGWSMNISSTHLQCTYFSFTWSQSKILGLIICLMLILASDFVCLVRKATLLNSYMGYTHSFSNLILPCSFSYPSNYQGSLLTISNIMLSPKMDHAPISVI